jgi:LPS-assembly lipoprotein
MRTSIRAAGAAALLLATSACGFTPLYAERGVVAGLQAIEVQVPQSRVGYLLREELDDEFARDRSQAPRYRLTVELDELRRARGLRVDDVASRYELLVTARYVLTTVGAVTPLAQGQAQATVTYDSADQPYAGVAAQTDAQERAAAQAAQRIRLDLARYFAASARAPARP